MDKNLYIYIVHGSIFRQASIIMDKNLYLYIVHGSMFRQASIIMDKNLYKASSPKSLADEKEAIKVKRITRENL